MQKTCLDCGKPVVNRLAIRCKSCARVFMLDTKRGHPVERIIQPCAECGSIVRKLKSNCQSKSGKVFCSMKCTHIGVARINSIRSGGDGTLRPKKEKDASYYQRQANKIRNKALGYYWANREDILSRKRAEHRALKVEMAQAYGGKCECCGESQIEFLTIDHINGGGAEHRRRVGKGRFIYEELKSLGFPKDKYRLLCYNCNITRGFNGYCPHHPEEKSNISHVPFNPGRKRKVA